MAITNNFTGFVVATTADYAKTDNDSEFGVNLNRSITKINRDYNYSTALRNTYQEGYINQFGASSSFSTNEQRLIQSMIRESINVNGITVRYMPRVAAYEDNVWNERPESRFERGTEMDMILVAAAGFEGEGDVMTQYGIEFREEVVLSMAIPRFEELYDVYEASVDASLEPKIRRSRPLEGDLIVIPFGRSASNRSQYVPKVFEISRVTTFHDGAFFQLGDNYQYKIQARLFELSGEDLAFNPTVVEYNEDGSQKTLIDSETGPISQAKSGWQILDSDTIALNIADDSDDLFDSWARNNSIELRARERTIYDSEGSVEEKTSVIVDDLSSKGHNQFGVIDNIDKI